MEHCDLESANVDWKTIAVWNGGSEIRKLEQLVETFYG